MNKDETRIDAWRVQPSTNMNNGRRRQFGIGFVCVAVLVVLAAGDVLAGDGHALLRITFAEHDKQRRAVEGRIVVEAQDGGILLQGRDGRLWNVTPEMLVKREALGKPFRPLTPDELAAQLSAEFGPGFEIVKTRHYVICTSAGKTYGRWCGALFERLMSSFQTHWRSRALQLHEPELPLSAIVFADSKQFAKFASQDADPSLASATGYYSIKTNRMILQDLTAGPNSRPAVTPADITRKVAASPFNVATVVHEATHQIAFNCGLHTRYADNPLWLTEGMAMYFETPDLRSRNGWRTVGKVNRRRLKRFRESVRSRRRNDSLETLLSGAERFGNSETSLDAYAEAWALTYFLIKTRRKQYIEYLRRLSKKPVLIWDDPQKRVEEFQAVFGEDLGKLQRDFLRYIRRQR